MGPHLPILFRAVQDEEEDLHHGLVGREVAPGAHGSAQLGVQRLDRVGGVKDATDVGRERVGTTSLHARRQLWAIAG